jgi:hypothetical protein
MVAKYMSGFDDASHCHLWSPWDTGASETDKEEGPWPCDESESGVTGLFSEL